MATIAPGRILRIVVITSTQKYIRPDNVGPVMVELWGGGSGGRNSTTNPGAGGNSSFAPAGNFAAAFSASGGSGYDGTYQKCLGGVGANGYLSLQGEDSPSTEGGAAPIIGIRNPTSFPLRINPSVGAGGAGDIQGGAGGGYSKSFINEEDMGHSANVVIGAGGAPGSGGVFSSAGSSGLCVITEYSKS